MILQSTERVAMVVLAEVAAAMAVVVLVEVEEDNRFFLNSVWAATGSKGWFETSILVANQDVVAVSHSQYLVDVLNKLELDVINWV